MDQSVTLEIICLRHGKTHYTGQQRDLTPEGEVHVRQVATDSVLPWMEKHRVDVRNLKIYSSPAPRAGYTAWNIAEVIRNKKMLMPTLLPEMKLGPTEQRDPARAKEVYSALSAGKRYVSYETEPAFQDSTIFETPREVRARWLAFFASYIRDSFRHGRRHSILVSHYEVLCNVVSDFFGITPTQEAELGHAEPIFLTITGTNDSDYVCLSMSFRGQDVGCIFNLQELTYHPIIE